MLFAVAGQTLWVEGSGLVLAMQCVDLDLGCTLLGAFLMLIY